MSNHKKINVSNQIHHQIEQESSRFKLSHKDYVEACSKFFLDRHLDPRTYQPETSKQSVQQAVDRIFSYLSYQEKHQLKDLYLETVKARILSELSVNHLLTLITEDESYLPPIAAEGSAVPFRKIETGHPKTVSLTPEYLNSKTQSRPCAGTKTQPPMHTKIIDPRRNGRFVFANRGSSSKIVSYLGHEAREQNKQTEFFNDAKSGITEEQVKSEIDANAKGLRKAQEKFYSLVLSPSQDELNHLSNDQQKLKDYTKAVMENYARNFNLPEGKQLKSSDLVWFATIHQEGKEKEGQQKGQVKAGGHTHVHILISAKDKTGEYRLNPKGRKSRFTFKDWQGENGKTFQKMFGYEKSTTSTRLTAGMPEETKAHHQERIRYRINHLNQYFTGSQKIDLDRAISIGKEQQYGKGFFFNLHRLTQQYKQSKPVNNPYQMLQTGKDEKINFPDHSLISWSKGVKHLGQEFEEEELGKPKKKRHRSQQQDQEIEQ